MKDSKYNALWKKASALLNKKPKKIQSILSKDVLGVMQELYTYQIELDMQNEELVKTQMELEESRNRYLQLYDFAPVAYLTLSKENLILEYNLTATKLFGMNKRPIKGLLFSKFISRESQDAFYLHKRRVFETEKPQNCVLDLLKADGNGFYGMLQSIRVQEKKGNDVSMRIVVTDISELRGRTK